MQADIDLFKKDRNEALLSMDKEKIIAYMARWGQKAIPNDKVFWASVHKARTACVDLPIEERQKSKGWLKNEGLTFLDDGDL